jgi:hypothetical protein
MLFLRRGEAIILLVMEFMKTVSFGTSIAFLQLSVEMAE